MTTGHYAGFSKLKLLSSSGNGVERWSATNAKGEHGELFFGGPDLIAAANDLPQGGVWGVVLSGIEEGRGWALIPGEITVSLEQLYGKLGAKAAFSIGLMLLEALDPLHVNWKSHRRFSPKRMGFDKNGALSVRPILDEPLFQDPSENSDPRATDCLMVGGVISALLGGEWPPTERNTNFDFETLDPSRAKLGLTGMLRFNSKLRLQPARHALQALTAALQGVDTEKVLIETLDELGIQGSLKSETPILPMGTDSKTNSELIQAFTDSVSPTSEPKWEAADSPVAISLKSPLETEATNAPANSTTIRVELPPSKESEESTINTDDDFGEAIPGSTPISSDPFRMVIPGSNKPPKIEASLPSFAIDLSSIDVLAPIPDITDEEEIDPDETAKEEAIAVLERVARAEAEAEEKARLEAEEMAKAKAEAEEKARLEAEEMAKAKAEEEEKAKAKAKAEEEKKAKKKAEAEALKKAKEEAKKLKEEIAAFEAAKIAEEERIKLVASTKAKARAKAISAQAKSEPEDLSFETDTTSPMIEPKRKSKPPKKKELSPKNEISWTETKQGGGILSRGDDVASEFSIGVGVGQKEDVDEDLGPGKWVESGRSAEELARDLPSVFSREMDFGPEKNDSSLITTIKWIAIFAVVAFGFLKLSKNDTDPTTEPAPNEQVRERASTSSTSSANSGAVATIISNVDGARVTFDGDLIGRQPVELPLPNDTRTHQLCLSKGGLESCINVTAEELASREPYQVTIE